MAEQVAASARVSRRFRRADKREPGFPAAITGYNRPRTRERGTTTCRPLPFDASRLDRLMDEAGIDVLLATSKHNVQYLLGGHRAFFFDYMDAMGLSRYLPVVVYPKGKPDKAAYFGHRLENFQQQVKPLWVARSAGELIRRARHDGEGDRLPAALRRAGASGSASRRRSCRWMPGAALRSAMPDSEIDGCAGRAGASALAQVAGGAGDAARRLREGDRVHDGGDRRSRSGHRPRRRSPRRCAARRSTAASRSSIA